jgi:type IV pilus assembly protein PilM
LKYSPVNVQRPIGVDVGPRAINAIQVSWKGGRWHIEAAAVVDRPAPEPGAARAPLAPGEAARLQDVLYRQGFTGGRIALAVPDSQLLTAVLELPPRGSGAPIEQLAMMELARVHKREPASLEMACWDIPAPARPGEASYIMAAACAHDDASQILDSFERAGLAVEALDARAWAMARACAPALKDDQNVSTLLELGEAGSSLVIIRSGVVVYDRLMPEAGLAALRARLSSELRVETEVSDFLLFGGQGGQPSAAAQTDAPQSPAAAAIIEEYTESVVQELRSAMDYALHRYPGSMDRLLVMGAGAGIPGLPARLAAGLGVPARSIAPVDVADVAGTLETTCRNPGLTTALGLATWERNSAA